MYFRIALLSMLIAFAAAGGYGGLGLGYSAYTVRAAPIVAAPTIAYSAPITRVYSAPAISYAAPITRVYSAPVTRIYSAPVTRVISAPITRVIAAPTVYSTSKVLSAPLLAGW